MAKIDVFVPPRPWPAVSKLLSVVNRVVMLHGIPLLRDIPLLRRIPGIRGLTDIRRINVEPSEIAKLKSLCESGAATFIVPNHPEFFTDWMIDKEIIARCCPNAASWATNGVVNGMGNAMQKFWLWNNLIAQIPGDSAAAKNHSIDWALNGNTVLLHPEGYVGWHSNYVAGLMQGAADMALEAKRRAPDKKAFLVPVVWKLEFTEDASAGIAAECRFVEKKLKIDTTGQGNPAERVYAIYDQLLDRELKALGLNVAPKMHALEKRRSIELVSKITLGEYLGTDASALDVAELVKQVRKKVRNEPVAGNAMAGHNLKLADRLQRIARLGDFAGKNAKITQEEIAEHLKRLRNDWCKGTLRDTINAYLPQPVARRTAHLRILEAVEVEAHDDARATMANVRESLQQALDEINLRIGEKSGWPALNNPFFRSC
jgi:hypothetical protein